MIADLIRISSPPQSNTHTHRANIRRLLHTHTPGGEKNTTDTERHFESRRDEREFYRETIPKIIKEKRRGRKKFLSCFTTLQGH